MAQENAPRVYGMADQANRDSPPTQGMRGEQAVPGSRARDPEFAHMITLENGKRVPVSEGNGVAYAEASGRVSRSLEREIDVDVVPEEQAEVASAPRRPKAPLLVGAVAAGAAAGIYLIERLRRSTDTQATITPTRQSEPVLVTHETGPLVSVQRLPHQQPILDEISPAAS